MITTLCYKYSEWNKYTEDALSKRYFWFSKPTYFNDPFDCNMECLLAFDTAKYIFGCLVNQKDSHNEQPFDLIKKQTNDFGVFCVTGPTENSNRAEKGYNNLHLWSQYADSHKGIALGFDTSILKSYYTKKLECNADLKPVQYRDQPINFDNDIVLRSDGNSIRTKRLRGIFGAYYDPKEADIFFEQLLLQKDAKTWGIERESRIILGGLAIENLRENNPFPFSLDEIINDQGYKIPYPEGDVLREVIFGAKFNKHKIRDVIEITSEHHSNVNFFQAHLDLKSYDITRDRLTT